MNQQCKVCGEPAAGFHFGAFTCEGCKSFFGRTYNNLGSISECKNGGVCVINKKNRTACKACRLRKCLMVGMSKSGSRYGRRSNWFKIHCLLQEQTTNGGSAVGLQSSHFPANFLPNFLPGFQTSSIQHGLLGNIQSQGSNSTACPSTKESCEETSPSREDLALHSHLLHVAMMKQKSRERNTQAQVAAAALAGSKSPRPTDDQLNLQGQLKMLGWRDSEVVDDQLPPPQQLSPPHQQHHYQHQVPMSIPGTPPLGNSSPTSESPTPPSSFVQQQPQLPPTSSIFHAVNLAAAAAAASGSLEVFRPFLPPSVYKRASNSPSDSGASSQESDGPEDDPHPPQQNFQHHRHQHHHQTQHHYHRSHHHLNQNHHQHQYQYQHQQQQKEDPPKRKINATLTLTTDYLPHHAVAHHGHHLLYTATELVTPAASHHSVLCGGDLLLASPSPGGLAIEQLEPIDLSVRSAKSLHLARRRRQRSSNTSSSPERFSPECSPKRQQLLDCRTSASLAECDTLSPAAPGKSNPLDLSLDTPVKRPTAEVSL